MCMRTCMSNDEARLRAEGERERDNMNIFCLSVFVNDLLTDVYDDQAALAHSIRGVPD